MDPNPLASETMRRPVVQTLRGAVIAGVSVAACVLLVPDGVQAAVGCSLANPEEDIRRFFPDMTDFTTQYLTYRVQAPKDHGRMGRLLGSRLDPVYETVDVPYTLYSVAASSKPVGYVFGANQRGRYSNIQVIAVTDARVELQKVYLQKIRSPAWEAFRSEAFSEALSGVPFGDYPGLRACYAGGRCAKAPIADPSAGSESQDFRAVLRSMAKLRILSRLLLRPGEHVEARDRASLAERIASWWSGELTARAVDAPRFVSPEDVDFLEPEDPVLLWPTGAGGRLYPLVVLNRHPVVNDRADGQDVGITWSPTSYTAIVLARSPSRRYGPSEEVLYGTRVVTDRPGRNTWVPSLGTALRGPDAPGTTARIAGTVVVPWRLARTHLPKGRVLVSSAPHDRVRALWDRYQGRYFEPTRADRVLAAEAGGAHVAWPVGEVVTGHVSTERAGRERLALVRDRGAASVFRLEGQNLIWAGRDPWTGAPWVWDQGSQTLWEAVTGQVIQGPEAARPLDPAVSFQLPRASFAALFPQGRVVGR